MMAEDHIIPLLATPTRFLIESGEWNLTPNNEINAFENHIEKEHYKQLPPPINTSPSISTSSNDSFHDDIPKKSTSSGRKRRIIFEGEDAEEKRKKFLERNRIAAYKCRQRKKSWIQDLEKNAEIHQIQNEELRTLVTQLKEESMYLRNLLLTHGNCQCESVQAYLRKTSLEISTKNTNPFFKTDSTDYFSQPHHPFS